MFVFTVYQKINKLLVADHYVQNVKKKLIDEMKNSEIFKSVLDRFPDAELIDVNSKKDGVDND